MTKPTVDDLLTGSRPRLESSVATEAALDALVLQARDAKPSLAKRRALWLVPAAMLRSTLPVDAVVEPESDIAEHVRELIACLPELDKEIVRLVYWEGFSQQEVAAIVGKPATVVRTRLSRARGALRARLVGSDNVE